MTFIGSIPGILSVVAQGVETLYGERKQSWKGEAQMGVSKERERNKSGSSGETAGVMRKLLI